MLRIWKCWPRSTHAIETLMPRHIIDDLARAIDQKATFTGCPVHSILLYTNRSSDLRQTETRGATNPSSPESSQSRRILAVLQHMGSQCPSNASADGGWWGWDAVGRDGRWLGGTGEGGCVDGLVGLLPGADGANVSGVGHVRKGGYERGWEENGRHDWRLLSSKAARACLLSVPTTPDLPYGKHRDWRHSLRIDQCRSHDTFLVPARRIALLA